MFLNKILLILIVAGIYNVNNVNAANKIQKTEQNQILKSETYVEDFYKMIDDYVTTQYSTCNIVTNEIKTECDKWGKPISRPSDYSKYTMLKTTSEIVLVKVLYNVIMNNVNNEEICNYEKPICICNVELPNTVINELIRITYYEKNRSDINFYLNEK